MLQTTAGLAVHLSAHESIESALVDQLLFELPQTWVGADAGAAALAIEGWRRFQAGLPEDCYTMLLQAELAASTVFERAVISGVRAQLALYQGEFENASTTAQHALDQIGVGHDALRAWLMAVQALACGIDGNLASARRVTARALALATMDGRALLPVLVSDAWQQLSLGHFALAQQKLRNALSVAQRLHPSCKVQLSLIHASLAGLAYDQDELHTARHHAEHAVDLGISAGSRQGQMGGLAILSRLEFAFKQTERAVTLAREALSVADSLDSCKPFADALCGLHLCALVPAESVRWAMAVASEQTIDNSLFSPAIRDWRSVCASRVLFAHGNMEDARHALSSAIVRVERGESGSAALVLSQLAAVQLALGNVTDAKITMRTAVRHSVDGALVRPFVDAGIEIYPLVTECLKHATTAEHASFADQVHRILAAFDRVPRWTQAPPGESRAGLRQSLTQREQLVLQLIAAGLSNSAIAMRLGTAMGTVKKQASACLRKLGASNRTEAVANARRAGLVAGP